MKIQDFSNKLKDITDTIQYQYPEFDHNDICHAVWVDSEGEDIDIPIKDINVKHIIAITHKPLLDWQHPSLSIRTEFESKAACDKFKVDNWKTLKILKEETIIRLVIS
jgi:hypothetical protein